MIQEDKVVVAFSAFIRMALEVGIYYINRALLILNLAPLYNDMDITTFNY